MLEKKYCLLWDLKDKIKINISNKSYLLIKKIPKNRKTHIKIHK